MYPTQNQPLLQVAQSIAQEFSSLPSVRAVVLGGSQSAGTFDPDSDIDLYIYLDDFSADDALLLAARTRLITRRAAYAELDNRLWEPGDEWVEAESGIHVDAMYRTVGWIEGELARVLFQHQAALGYSTSTWHNVRTSHALFDRDGWWARLHSEAQQPYPAALAQAIIAKNYPVLRRMISSYTHQIELAVKRADRVSIQHRITALLASYFDILFALNQATHPGEKRLLVASRQLALRPAQMEVQVEAVVAAAGAPLTEVMPWLHLLLDGLDALLTEQDALSTEAKLAANLAAGRPEPECGE